MLPKATGEDRREQLLRCAKMVFAQRGYHAASVADIIDAADVARGTFYLYFDGKRQIFDVILDDLLASIGQQIEVIEISPLMPAPLEQLRANLERVLALVLSDRDLVVILLHQAQGLDGDCQDKLEQFYQSILVLIESALRMGMSMGLVRTCDPRLAAAAILGAGQGIVALATRMQPTPAVKSIADQMLDIALYGLLKPLPRS
ncbi:TetR/AcrR family transcriptional regulator [Hydrogenophaga sp.]|uniref:TetR/AcrR family transcriptional regulator n=1 Tax=Hydrogenophaga sp. TaxID=1904254 RepID=UPI0019908080|nr:TetR/AcrR family transcriptional regulator [Hydrogenophaga sp.]MBD3893762.1 TetR/AcrR family transcriptional regulator [Hydrogenophaga sp.]